MLQKCSEHIRVMNSKKSSKMLKAKGRKAKNTAPPVPNIHVESLSELEKQAVNDEPIFSVWVDPDEDKDLASSCDSDNENILKDVPLFAAWTDPNDPIKHRQSESLSKWENEKVVNADPTISTYIKLDEEKDSELSSESESQEDGPMLSTYVAAENETESDTSSESEDDIFLHIQPSFTTYIPPAPMSKETSSDSEVDDLVLNGPLISTYVGSLDNEEVSGEQVMHHKPKVHVQRTNKVVRELEAIGLKPKIRTPKFRLYPYGKPNTFSKQSQRRARKRDPADYVYHCPKCPKIFNKSGNLARHIEDIHHRKLYKCAVCGSRLSSKRGWKSHEKVHAFDYVKPQCIYCGQVFSTSNARANHVRRGKCPMKAYR